MYTFKDSLRLPLSLEDCWAFFSSPMNLRKITPDYLDLRLSAEMDVNKDIYAGQIIAYTVKPLFNIPFEWVTEITQVEKPYYFIDEQRKGPYKIWHHEHRFKEIPGGIEMNDLIYYELPYGILGRILLPKVRKDVKAIFAYRKERMKSMFGVYS